MFAETDIVVDDVKRAYVVDGRYIPRVSAVVNHFYPWVANPWIPPITGERAMQAGTEMHASIEGYLRGEYEITKVDGDGGNFERYMSEYPEWKTVACEKKIASTKCMLAGTLDALFQNTETEEYILVDWKRSRRLYEDSGQRYAMQATLYKHLLEVECGVRVSHSYIVLLHPDLKMPSQFEVTDGTDGLQLEYALGVAKWVYEELNKPG